MNCPKNILICSLSYSHQNDAINDAKKHETRAKTIDKMLRQLSSEKQSNKQILRTIFLIFAFNFSVIFPAIAADSTVSKSVCNIILSDFNAAYSDGKYLVREFLTPQIGHLLYPAVGISSTIVAAQFDERIRYPEHSRYTDRILKQAGELSTAAALPSIIYLSGLIFDDDEVRTTGRMLFESLLLAGVINGTLKYSLGRARPFMNMGNSQFEYFELDNSYQSLPSGHTTVAFTCASLLSERINNIYASIALYAIAGGTAYERIRSDNHWFSDVVLGAGIGIFSAYSIVEANKYVGNSENNNSNSNYYGMRILPMINHAGFGLRLSAEF